MPVTVLSMLIAVIVVGIGLLIVGFGSSGWRTLLLGGLIIGFGVASMHYIGMAAMRMPDTVRYNNGLVVLSVVIAVVAGTAALWAALRLTTVGSTLIASLIMGVAVSGMHYTGIAAMHVYGTQDPGMLAAMSGGVSAQAFLLPLIIGISILAFVLTVIISLSPTEAEMREDAALMAHLSGRPGPVREAVRSRTTLRQGAGSARSDPAGCAARRSAGLAAGVLRRTPSHLCISVRKSGIGLRDGACARP